MNGAFSTAKNGLSVFVRDNWFKLLLVGLALYIFFQRDLSFQVQLNAPSGAEPVEPPTQVDGAAKREKMTQRERKTAKAKEERGLFDLSSVLHSGSAKRSLAMDALAPVSEELRLAYLKRFAKVALVERQKFGVPASLILANALLHSTAGQAGWASGGNNHFALPCTDTWPGESGLYRGQCLRHYESAWASFRDHSLFLRKEWKNKLPFDRRVDYQEWAAALARGPYANESGLEQALTSLIEQYRLYELDEAP